MSFRVSLLFLTMTVVVIVCGQKKRPAKEEWNYRDGCERMSFLFNKTHTGLFLHLYVLAAML